MSTPTSSRPCPTDPPRSCRRNRQGTFHPAASLSPTGHTRAETRQPHAPTPPPSATDTPPPSSRSATTHTPARPPSSHTPPDDGPSAESWCGPANDCRPYPPSPTRTPDTRPPSPRSGPSANRPSGSTTISGHTSQSRNTSPGWGRASAAPAAASKPGAGVPPTRVPAAGPGAPETREPELGVPAPPTRAPTEPDGPPAGSRSAASRACANSLNNPFGNRRRYASNSDGFVLFMTDCQEQALELRGGSRGCGRSGPLTRRGRLLLRRNRGRPDGSRPFPERPRRGA